MSNNTITYAIENHIATLSTSKKGWNKEVNLISWNGAPAKIDIRDWDPDHAKMGKGITLSTAEATNLLNALRGVLDPSADPEPAKPQPEPVSEPAKPQPEPVSEPVDPSGYSAAQLAQIAAARAMMNNK